MVTLDQISPLYIVAVALGVSFALGIIGKAGKTISYICMMLALAAMFFISAVWLYGFIVYDAYQMTFFTAGLKPPFSISLTMGLHEAFFTFIMNAGAFFGGLYLFDILKKKGYHAMITFLIMIMGWNVVVLTNDIFNLFVFLEVAGIATAGLIILVSDVKTVQAGFKYMIATGIISGLFLLGIIFSYYLAGSLSIADLAAANIGTVKAGGIALFLLVSAFVIELKPFPANGWALDVYEAAHPGIAAIISAVSATAAFYALSKILVIAGDHWYSVIATLGLITFAGSNLLALKQTNSRRLLGYSSIGQIGLVMTALGFYDILGDKIEFVVFGLIVTHIISKAGLFWLAGIVKKDHVKEWVKLRKNAVLFAIFGAFIFALVGFPPFPAFFAKWEFVLKLAESGNFIFLVVILAASFVEGIYLFRWFGYALKLENDELSNIEATLTRTIPVLFAGMSLLGVSYFFTSQMGVDYGINYIPLAFILFIALFDFLPAWVKNIISICGVGYYLYSIYPLYTGDMFRFIFLMIFLGGAVLTLTSGFYYKGKRLGFYPMALAMFAGLSAVIEAQTTLQFLYGWELMAIGSYFLLIRGKKSMPHGFSYMLFSLGGSLAIMTGFAFAFAGSNTIDLSSLVNISVFPVAAYILMLAGFMTKTASLGFHIWLPGAHGEAVADIHFMASAILLKAGVFGIIVVLLAMGTEAPYASTVLYILAWAGALSAFAGNLGAVFQESAKRLLAWSSIGQLGYVVFGLATMSHLGWLLALNYAITHFLYKGILFLIIGGIALKLGTPYMYKMGGLIKRMPFSFVAVLIAIITLSGVPPLVGFSNKWLLYNTIISEQYFYTGIITIFSGIIAFLYLFRLIHTIFLGQLKDNLRKTGEINIWFLIPAYFLIGSIMYISMFPRVLLEPLGAKLAAYFPDGVILWEGSMASTYLGYFDGSWIMYISGAIFVIVFLWLFLINRDAKWIKQFNIVYAAERPSTPELTHFAYNFFAPYKKALGYFMVPRVMNFWSTLGEWIHSAADFIRRIYSGNGQAYALHIIIFVIVIFYVAVGGW
jgi:formate hydrogenlyase subunit 3/multisubunit Na+/H+ antiporter MnhD subunit